ncbi:Mediator of RNA polymerase II transcription subunit 26 [Orchesella cincta]|uniref:Mediator of RNA polymerase II transcription subunit 26 n=1 Tax=Orchesella cincta TaxID=48709 RepID=A0A1D2MXZ7_ORCCI|nr:Mediator of RNA polymerase II transcription subunit 26 [Orchesella cincta]
MQEDRQQEPYFLRAKLLEAVDAEYNVKDMSLILEVLGKLEVLPVTKEILESTRLGKTVNEFRRKVNDPLLAKRLKALVKKWRDAVLTDEPPRNHVTVNGTSSKVSERPGGNRHLPTLTSGYTSASSSPTLASSSRVSPAGSYNSNSLSPRIGTVTNHSNNTSVNSLAANRNGSSSIASRSPNHRNLQLPASSHVTLVSPSASTASPLLNSRHLVSPHKSRSPGGPSLSVFNSHTSNLSPLPSSHYQSSTTSSYAPNAETVSRTNAANKRYRELDDSPLSASTEPPAKKSRSGVNGTLDDPLLALDDISRDSYASRGSDHSDGFTSKDNRFSVSVPSPAALSQASVHSPSIPATGIDSNVPSPANLFDTETANISQINSQPKKKRRKKQTEDINDAIRAKIVQAQAEKAAKAARELEIQNKDKESVSVNPELVETRRRYIEGLAPEDKLANNVIVETYLKSQNELQVKMERDILARRDRAESDFKGADEGTLNQRGVSVDKSKGFSKKEKKKHKKKHDEATEDISNANPFPSEAEILSKLPPLDPEILKEFANYEYDVTLSPLQPDGDSNNTNNRETESTNNLKSLSTIEVKPPKKIDWGDSDDEDDTHGNDGKSDVVLSQQVPVALESSVDISGSQIIGSEDITDYNKVDLEPTPVREVNDADIESYIKDEVPNLNGNHDKDGQFREWHETLTVESYKSEPLHILPYTIIDF